MAGPDALIMPGQAVGCQSNVEPVAPAHLVERAAFIIAAAGSGFYFVKYKKKTTQTGREKFFILC